MYQISLKRAYLEASAMRLGLLRDVVGVFITH